MMRILKRFLIFLLSLTVAQTLLPTFTTAAPVTGVKVTPKIAETTIDGSVVFTAEVSVSNTHLEADDGWYVIHEDIVDEDQLQLGEWSCRLDPAESSYQYSYDWFRTEDYFGWDESSFRYSINGNELTVFDFNESIGKAGFYYQCTGSTGWKYRSAVYDELNYSYDGECRISLVSGGKGEVIVTPEKADTAPGSPAVFTAKISVDDTHLEENDGWYVCYCGDLSGEDWGEHQVVERLDPDDTRFVYEYADWPEEETDSPVWWYDDVFDYSIKGNTITVSGYQHTIGMVGFFYQCTGQNGVIYRSVSYDAAAEEYIGASHISIIPEALSAGRITLDWTKTTYDGTFKKPGVTVLNSAGDQMPDDVFLRDGKSFTEFYYLTYSAKDKAPGTYTVTLTGRNGVTGTVTKQYTVEPQSLTASRINMSWTSKPYSGADLRPAVTVKNAAGETLKEGTDYTVSFPDQSKKAGTYTVSVTGKGNYGATVKKTYTITEHTPHTWDSGKVTKKATCAAAGVKTFTCTVCGAVKTETIAKTTNHTWDAGKVTKKATEKTEGVKTFTCTVCGTTKTEIIPKNKPAEPKPLPGDVDGNGKVESADARLALRTSVKLEKSIVPGSLSYNAADYDKNGKVESSDARCILRVSVKLDPFQ